MTFVRFVYSINGHFFIINTKVMEEKKKKTSLGKMCLTSKEAAAIAEKNLYKLGEIRKNLLSKFESEIKAYQYKKSYIWLVSIVSNSNNERLAMFVDVKTSEVFNDIISVKELHPLEKAQSICIKNKTLWYYGNEFVFFKDKKFLSLSECNTLWQKQKDNHLPYLRSHNYTVYDHPKAVIEKETPIFVIAFHHMPFTQNVETLIVYPNCGNITNRVISKYRWRKLKKKIGDFTIKELHTKITIGDDGFIVEHV